MNMIQKTIAAFLVLVSMALPAHAQTDPLPSWNESVPKQTLLKFIADTTTEGNANYVPIAERIAVFDNDGTLWAENPIYFQLAYVRDRIQAIAPQHPEWKEKQPFKAIIENDKEQILANGPEGLLTAIAATST